MSSSFQLGRSSILSQYCCKPTRGKTRDIGHGDVKASLGSKSFPVHYTEKMHLWIFQEYGCVRLASQAYPCCGCPHGLDRTKHCLYIVPPGSPKYISTFLAHLALYGISHKILKMVILIQLFKEVLVYVNDGGANKWVSTI